MSAQVPKSMMLTAATTFKTANCDGGSLKIYTNDFTPDLHLSTDPAQFTEATFGGYAASVIAAFNPAIYDQDTDSIILDSASVQFVHSNAVDAGNLCYGYYFVDTAGTAVVCAERFPSPVNVPSEHYAVEAKPVITFEVPSAS